MTDLVSSIRFGLLGAFVLAVALLAARAADSSADAIAPVCATEPVAGDADDPAIWRNEADPASSLIIATDKVGAPSGALAVFDLDGGLRQLVSGIDRPNNVDVEYGLALGGERVDIAVTTERGRSSLRFFAVGADGLAELPPAGGLRVFEGCEGDEAAPMGIGLYRRPGDGRVFAVVSRKSGPSRGYLWQYEIHDDGAGALALTKVRELGDFSGEGEIEALCVDDEAGFIYYADEALAIRQWAADPDSPDAGHELAQFGTEGFGGDREGIAILPTGPGAGWIVCTDQVESGSFARLYRREGEPGAPYAHPLVGVVATGADETDGLEICGRPLGPSFPEGLVVAMNSGERNFLLYDLRDLAPGR